MPEQLRDLVLQILQQPPVSDIIALSDYTPTLAEAIPIASLHPTAAPAAKG